MRSARIAGVFLVVIGAAVGFEASTFEVSFMADPIGPKALPNVVAAMLLMAGFILMLRPKTNVVWPNLRVRAKLVGAVMALLFYPLALHVLGFVISTMLVVTGLSHLYGAPLRRGLAAAAILSVVLWLFFVQMLALPLPIGSVWLR